MYLIQYSDIILNISSHLNFQRTSHISEADFHWFKVTQSRLCNTSNDYVQLTKIMVHASHVRILLYLILDVQLMDAILIVMLLSMQMYML